MLYTFASLLKMFRPKFIIAKMFLNRIFLSFLMHSALVLSNEKGEICADFHAKFCKHFEINPKNILTRGRFHIPILGGVTLEKIANDGEVYHYRQVRKSAQNVKWLFINFIQAPSNSTIGVFILSRKDNTMIGSVISDGRVFEIVHSGNVTHIVKEKDPTHFLPEKEAILPPIHLNREEFGSRERQLLLKGIQDQTSPSIVSVKVYYTPQVNTYFGFCLLFQSLHII